jgi:hypothetical protein
MSLLDYGDINSSDDEENGQSEPMEVVQPAERKRPRPDLIEADVAPSQPKKPKQDESVTGLELPDFFTPAVAVPTAPMAPATQISAPSHQQTTQNTTTSAYLVPPQVRCVSFLVPFVVFPISSSATRRLLIQVHYPRYKHF